MIGPPRRAIAWPRAADKVIKVMTMAAQGD
jgi:hypothetical protein